MELNEIYEVEKKFDAEIETVAALAELETIGGNSLDLFPLSSS